MELHAKKINLSQFYKSAKQGNNMWNTQFVSTYSVLHYLSVSLIPCFFGFCVDGRTYIYKKYGTQSKITNDNTQTGNLYSLYTTHPISTLTTLFHIHIIIKVYFFKCLSVHGNYLTAAFRYHMSTSYIYHLHCQTSYDLSNVLQSIMSVFDQLI